MEINFPEDLVIGLAIGVQVGDYNDSLSQEYGIQYGMRGHSHIKLAVYY